MSVFECASPDDGLRRWRIGEAMVSLDSRSGEEVLRKTYRLVISHEYSYLFASLVRKRILKLPRLGMGAI